MKKKERVMPLTDDMCVRGGNPPPRAENFKERQIRLLESIDRKLDKLVKNGRLSSG